MKWRHQQILEFFSILNFYFEVLLIQIEVRKNAERRDVQRGADEEVEGPQLRLPPDHSVDEGSSPEETVTTWCRKTSERKK